MYTSVMLVALLSPGATPTVAQAPVRQVVYGTTSGQVVYLISTPSVRYLSPVVSSPTTVYAQPTSYVVSSNPGVITTYGSPVVVSGGSVIRYASPVYTTSGMAQPATYAPVMMPMGSVGVCRT